MTSSPSKRWGVGSDWYVCSFQVTTYSLLALAPINIFSLPHRKIALLFPVHRWRAQNFLMAGARILRCTVQWARPPSIARKYFGTLAPAVQCTVYKFWVRISDSEHKQNSTAYAGSKGSKLKRLLYSVLYCTVHCKVGALTGTVSCHRRQYTVLVPHMRSYFFGHVKRSYFSRQ